MTMDTPVECLDDLNRYSNWITEIVRNACDIAALVVRVKNRRRQVSGEISELRSIANRARRTCTRARRKLSGEELTKIKVRYNRAKKAFQRGIKRARNAS